VTILPRYIIINNLDQDLQCRQHGTNSSIVVKPLEFKAIHYLKPMDEHLLGIKMTGLLNEWSQAFVMNQIGVLYLKLGMTGSEEEDLVRVEVLLDGAALFIAFSRNSDGRWPISIDNTCDQDIVVWQADCKCHYIVQKQAMRNYAWDKPSVQLKILIVHINGREREVDVSDIGHTSYVRYPVDMKATSFRVASIQVLADGPSLIIRIAHKERHESESPALVSPVILSAPMPSTNALLSAPAVTTRRLSNTDSLASLNRSSMDDVSLCLMSSRALRRRRMHLLGYHWKGLEFLLLMKRWRRSCMRR
jgi:hypothetical protein